MIVKQLMKKLNRRVITMKIRIERIYLNDNIEISSYGSLSDYCLSIDIDKPFRSFIKDLSTVLDAILKRQNDLKDKFTNDNDNDFIRAIFGTMCAPTCIERLRLIEIKELTKTSSILI